MNASAWDALKAIAADPTINARRPIVGTVVRVIEGPMMGLEGRVTWHGIDKFNRTAFRYCSDMQAHLRDLRGQWGYRVRVEAEGGKPLFIGAEKVCVLKGAA